MLRHPGPILMIDAHLFQITRTAVLICLHLPLTKGSDPVAFLNQWQTLIGALVGGLMGVVGALIVAARATRRGRRIAASSVLPELMGLQAANLAIDHAVGVSHLDNSKSKQLVCNMLLRSRPTIRFLQSPVITQLYDIDARLYSHICLCNTIHEQLEPELERYRNERCATEAASSSAESAVSGSTSLDYRATEAVTVWDLSVEHAALAHYYLDRFIFRAWPIWAFRLRMRLFPNDLDRRSAHLLSTGKLLHDGSNASHPD